MVAGQLLFILYSQVSFFLNQAEFYCCLVRFLGGKNPEKLIVCLLDLIYYLHYSNTYMIQAESENRTLLCLVTHRSVVRARLGQENVCDQVCNKT